MVVWIGVITLVFGWLSVQHAATGKHRAAALALFFSVTFDVLWFMYVFRGVV